jgi:hypothetical protein
MCKIFEWIFYFSDSDDDIKIVGNDISESICKVKKFLLAHSQDFYLDGYYFEWDEQEDKGVIYDV